MHLFFSDLESPVINIMYGWSGMYGQFGISSILFSFVTSLELIILYLGIPKK